MKSERIPIYLAVVFTCLMNPLSASAHLNTTGMGPVYDGLMHFLTSPEDIIPGFALALLAGLRGASHGRRALITLPMAWLLGGLFGLTASSVNGSPILAALWFLLVGSLLAADAKLSLRVMTALSATLGLYHGYLNGTGMGRSFSAAAALLGLVFGVFVLIALASAFVVRLRVEWARVAVRVGGSWVCATGFLMLGWALRSK